MPLEALRLAVTPIGLHYLLTHYDIPIVGAHEWQLEIGGHVETPRTLSLDEILAHPADGAHGDAGMRRQRPGAFAAAAGESTLAQRSGRHCRDRHATRTAAGRSRLQPARLSSWCSPASTAATSAGSSSPSSAACRSARRSQTTCCWRGRSTSSRCRPSTAFRCACSCPAGTGWPRQVAVADHGRRPPLSGHQQSYAYRLRRTEDEEGEPLTRMLPRALLIPPASPIFRPAAGRSGRPLHARGVGLVGLRAHRAGRRLDGRRRVVGAGGARAGRRLAVRLVPLAPPLRRVTRRARPCLSRSRRERTHPAAGAGLEPERLREQRRPARPGHIA